MENKRIDLIDEALKVAHLESLSFGSDTVIDNESKQVESLAKNFAMPVSRETEMLAKLTGLLTAQSLGQLITHQLEALKISQDQLSENTLVPVDVIKNLMADKIYTNNVPIVLFKKLVNYLQLGMNNVESAIRKTFDVLENMPTDKADFKLSPTFRKGFYLSKDASSLNSARSDGKELFENKEALEKYLSRLKELMN